MKMCFRLLVLSLFFVLVAGCSEKHITGTGNIDASARSVSEFSAVAVSGVYDVTLTEGKPQVVTIKSNPNLLPYIESYVKGDTLYIASKKGYDLKPQGKQGIEIIVPTLHKIVLSGNNHLSAINLVGDSLELNFSGANQGTIMGQVKELNIDVSGENQIDALKMPATKVAIQASGNTMIQVNAINKLNIDIAGAGTIKYVGNPSISQTVNGSAVIEKLPQTQQ